eukprot:gene1541-1512_t
MRLEKRNHTSPAAYVLAPLGAVVFTLIVSALLVLWAGAPVGQTYALLLQGAFGSVFALTETLTRATPLILTGLAAAVAFRARLFNIGAEGQLYAGALAAVAVGGMHGGTGLEWSPYVLFPLMMLAAALAGAALLLGPALMKARLGVDEVVTTLLLNFIMLLLVSALLDGPMKDPLSMGWPQSVALQGDLELSKLVPQTRLHTGLLWAVSLAVMLWALLARTVPGFDIRAAGANARAAAFAGVPITRTVVLVALLSGGLAGLAGAIEVAGRTSYVTLDMSPGYGYSGIVITMLAGLHPLGVIAAGTFVAGVLVGADSMSRAVGVPTYIADVIVATSLIAVLVAGLLTQYRLLDILANPAFWIATLRVATPLILGTLGVLLCERAGVLNLGIEGIMVAGAFTGWLTVYAGHGLWTGVLVAALTGSVFGLLHAWLTVGLALSQHVSGLGITLLATALSYYGYRVSFPKVNTPPTIEPFAPMEWLGIPILSAQTPLTLLALLLVPLLAWLLMRTPLGLAVRMVGENPQAAEGQGVSVAATRTGSIVAGSALMGVAGSFLTLSAFNAFFFNMINGRGWICVALVVFASWRPGKALLGALLFAFFDALQLRLQQAGDAWLPYQVYLMLPYLLSILALVLVARKAAYPQALMKPYRKGER